MPQQAEPATAPPAEPATAAPAKPTAAAPTEPASTAPAEPSAPVVAPAQKTPHQPLLPRLHNAEQAGSTTAKPSRPTTTPPSVPPYGASAATPSTTPVFNAPYPARQANTPAAEPNPQFSNTSTLDDVQLVSPVQKTPHKGWRKVLYKASFGHINPGPSPDEIYEEKLIERIRQPIRGDYRIACLSLKGGVGKTTTTVGLGSTFANLRGDRIIAIDANPDLGTLGQRVPQQTSSTVRDLLEDPNITRYSDVRAHTSQSRARLEVLASEQDPAVSESYSEKDYRRTVEILQSYYNVILTDCGTGLMHDAMGGVLDLANSLVLVTSPAIDGARSAWSTLDWLEAHGCGHLVERTVVAICSSRAGSINVDLKQLQETFGRRCAAVHLIPYDEHLAEGSEIDIERLGKSTRRAFLELAASVADGFSQTLLPSNMMR